MSMAPSGEDVPPPPNISLAVVLSVDGIAEQLARQLSVTHVGYLARTHPTISSNLPNSVWKASVKATGAAERSRLLFVASLAGDAEKLRLLCSSPVEATTIDYRDRASGKSCVWAAAEGGHLAAVRLLADEGASFKSNRCQPYGRTPLWAAAAMGYRQTDTDTPAYARTHQCMHTHTNACTRTFTQIQPYTHTRT